MRLETIKFINDSICLYTQEYKCNIKEYRKTEIQCTYKIVKDLVLLSSFDQPLFLKGLNCFSIPDSILKDCDFIFEDTKQNPFYINLPTQWNKSNLYGFINNINGTDTLLYHKGCLFYSKKSECFEINNIVLSTKVFTEQGRNKLKGKDINRIFKSKDVPIN